MKSFKDAASKMMMFGKQMSDAIGEEQAKALETAEEERNLATQESEKLRKCLDAYKDMTAAIAMTLSQRHVPYESVADLQKQLDTYKSNFTGSICDTHMSNFIDDMHSIVSHFKSKYHNVETQTEETVEREVGIQIIKPPKNPGLSSTHTDTVAKAMECVDDTHVDKEYVSSTEDPVCKDLLYYCEELIRLLKQKHQLQEDLAGQTKRLNKMKLDMNLGRQVDRKKKTRLEDTMRQIQSKQEIHEKELQVRVMSAMRVIERVYDQPSQEARSDLRDRPNEKQDTGQPTVRADSKVTVQVNSKSSSHPSETQTHKQAAIKHNVAPISNAKFKTNYANDSKNSRKETKTRTSMTSGMVYPNVNY